MDFQHPSGVGLLVIIVFEHNVLDGVESGLTTLSGGKGLLLLDVFIQFGRRRGSHFMSGEMAQLTGGVAATSFQLRSGARHRKGR